MVKIRKWLAMLCILVTLCCLGAFIFYTYLSWKPHIAFKDMKLNDLIKSALQLKIDKSRSEFQIGLLLMGALWAFLIIGKKDEAKHPLSDWPEKIMFLCANLIVLISCLFHIGYIEDIIYIYYVAGGLTDATSIPDVFSTMINNPYNFQYWSMLGGLVVTSLTFFSVFILKENNKCK
jgi:hypothetical protein